MLACELCQSHPADEAPGNSVFKTFPILMTDITRAGITHIDSQGRVARFHSFRKTSQTPGVLHGVNQRAAQEFLGCSDANLIAKIYTDIPKASRKVRLWWVVRRSFAWSVKERLAAV